jgi:hypothetical protein
MSLVAEANKDLGQKSSELTAWFNGFKLSMNKYTTIIGL